MQRQYGGLVMQFCDLFEVNSRYPPRRRFGEPQDTCKIDQLNPWLNNSKATPDADDHCDMMREGVSIGSLMGWLQSYSAPPWSIECD